VRGAAPSSRRSLPTTDIRFILFAIAGFFVLLVVMLGFVLRA
jgi:hypothetical protein